MSVISITAALILSPKSFLISQSNYHFKLNFSTANKNAPLSSCRNLRISVSKASEDGFVVVEDDLHALLGVPVLLSLSLSQLLCILCCLMLSDGFFVLMSFFVPTLHVLCGFVI